MNYNIFTSEAFVKLATAVFDFVGKPNPVEYAKAVKELHDPEVTHKILENRINDIENDPQLSRNEKEKYKDEVMARYYAEDINHMQASADVVDREVKNKNETVNNLLYGSVVALTAISAVYGVTNGFHNYPGQLQIVPKPTR